MSEEIKAILKECLKILDETKYKGDYCIHQEHYYTDDWEHPEFIGNNIDITSHFATMSVGYGPPINLCLECLANLITIKLKTRLKIIEIQNDENKIPIS